MDLGCQVSRAQLEQTYSCVSSVGQVSCEGRGSRPRQTPHSPGDLPSQGLYHLLPRRQWPRSRPQALPAFLARDGRSKTTGRGRRLPSFLPRGCKQGCDSCRTSSVWGAGSSFQPLRGLPSSLSDLSGLPRCDGTSGLFPPSCGERTLPPKPLIYTPAPVARRRPGRPPSHLFRGRDPALRSGRRELWLPPQPAGAARARFSQPFRTCARARLSPAREAAGESASEAKLTGLVAVGMRGEEVLPRLVPGLLPASPAPQPAACRHRARCGAAGPAPEGAPRGAQLTATGESPAACGRDPPARLPERGPAPRAERDS